MSKTLYIIDGHSQIYRAYYAPFRDLTSPAGEPTRATYVFCSMLLKFVAAHNVDYLAMAVDGPAEQLHRRRRYAQYKVTRKPMPDDLPPQVDRIIELVETMGIPVLRAAGYEADDIMATAAVKFASDELKVVLVSRDKDLDQLVGDNVILFDPMKNQTITAADIEADKGYPPAKAVEVQTLMGDSIDNIPGIPGVGPRTAARLIAQYGSADSVVDHADELTPKLRQNVLACADKLPLARELVTLDVNVPIELDLSAMEFAGIATGAISPIFRELGFTRLLDQLSSHSAGDGEAAEASPAAHVDGANHDDGMTTAADFDYRCIDTPEALDALAAELSGVEWFRKVPQADGPTARPIGGRQRAGDDTRLSRTAIKRLAVDTETTSTRPMLATLVGISLAWQPGRAVYIPVRGPLGARVLPVDVVRDAIGPILADESVEKIAHNIKYDAIVLSRAGMALAQPWLDTMVAAGVLDATRRTYKLDALASELLNHRCIPIEQVIGRGRNQTTMDTVPVDTVAPYAAEDADVTFRLARVLDEHLAKEPGLADLLRELEMPLTPVLVEMEQLGIAVAADRLRKMESQFAAEADILRERIIASAGREFNVDSPRQLAEILFDELQLPILKRGKTGPSTSAAVLEQLAVQHDLPALVLDYRKLTKLLSTYLKSLAECIHPETHRVHTSFHQTGTVTGRLSSSDPNLQNIPIRSPEGRQIRSAFVAKEGCVLLSADYSQVELRVLAHFCGDETLMAAFEQDVDIHRAVAAEVFGVAIEDVTPDQRARAKTVNFGIIYGQTAFGLSVTLRIPQKEAAEFIRNYRRRFGKIDEFLRTCVEAARADGYVETIFGRRRRITDIDAANPTQRAAAERLAINSVVQGSAADLIKRAMVNIAARIRNEKRPARMLLQIHDELLFEIPRDAVDPEREMIVAEMTGAIELRVGLKVDIGIGENWMDAK